MNAECDLALISQCYNSDERPDGVSSEGVSAFLDGGGTEASGVSGESAAPQGKVCRPGTPLGSFRARCPAIILIFVRRVKCFGIISLLRAPCQGLITYSIQIS